MSATNVSPQQNGSIQPGHESNGDRLNTNLIINYLPKNMTQDELKRIFSIVGVVKRCKLMTVGRFSLGYGFVDYFRPEDAESAINRLNGLRLQNKNLKVSYASPSCDASKGANLYISGLPNNISDEELLRIFKRYGTIVSHRLLPGKADSSGREGSSQAKRACFIRYDQRIQAIKAIKELNGSELFGMSSPLTVRFANKRNNSLQMLSSKHFDHAHHNSSDKATMNTYHRRFTSMGYPPTMLPQRNGNNGTCLGWSIFVYNIARTIEEDELCNIFQLFGAVYRVKIFREKRFGFVNMVNYGEAVRAIQTLNGCLLNGYVIQVAFKTNKHGSF